MKLTLESNFSAAEFAAACRAAAETCGLSRCPVAPFKCPFNYVMRLGCSIVKAEDWVAVAEYREEKPAKETK